jgi:GNAT superfamily N-acetyltransferase
MLLSIIKATVTDLDPLLNLSRKTFEDAFRYLNNPDDFDAYFKVAFSREKILSELEHPYSDFYVAFVDDAPAGYIKLNYGDAQTEFCDKTAIEVERIYVLAKHQGKQIGKKLLNFTVEKAHEQRMKHIWLGVWEKNHGAIRFYEQNGFKLFGSHDFVLGTNKQTDLLMTNDLS